ncbi:hypothetical protein AVEN_28953-1 [Araneus ventricosus]|uniref:Uncharacterized protein n=1 Tax=Araneus ventricosus TaxID=182803 RepID=A0A4Y2AJ50_ARAVE|nr:hypothetical protein AVEN_28953-1 [Araneus ventricosus]
MSSTPLLTTLKSTTFPYSKLPGLVSLVILTSRFEATRGVFWDGPRKFEPRLDDEDDTRTGAHPLHKAPGQSQMAVRNTCTNFTHNIASSRACSVMCFLSEYVFVV